MRLHKFAYKPDASGRKTRRTCADTPHLKRSHPRFLISPWISSHLARFQKLQQTSFRSNVAGFTNILCEKQTCKHRKKAVLLRR